MSKKRVVITGIEHHSRRPQCSSNLQSLKTGVCGVGMISRFDATGLPVQIAAEVKNYNPEEHFDHKEVKKLDLYIPICHDRRSRSCAGCRTERRQL
jgi:3-oxoacyl-[acyl-carrier-protein] synthase II